MKQFSSHLYPSILILITSLLFPCSSQSQFLPLFFSYSSSSMASSITQISLFLLFLTLFSETQLSQSLKDLKPNPNRPSTSLQSITDIHDLLPKYGLPRGLLPDNGCIWNKGLIQLSFTLGLCPRNCLLNSSRIFLYVRARLAEEELVLSQCEVERTK
ncbi:uncharacterized protein LOC133728244 [Rosa rugosa]|uniref:uncharacterized protein LOC133728244 n=1 Tax=Rosa rugosa TaxID=74645 RepID=UPI002B40FAB9|nr:uncharacterized protein LOC133728244 [Rosa rugosa]